MAIVDCAVFEQGRRRRGDLAWVAVVAMPTTIAGIPGRDVEELPGLAWTLGHPLVLGLLALVGTTLHDRPRRAGRP